MVARTLWTKARQTVTPIPGFGIVSRNLLFGRVPQRRLRAKVKEERRWVVVGRSRAIAPVIAATVVGGGR